MDKSNDKEANPDSIKSAQSSQPHQAQPQQQQPQQPQHQQQPGQPVLQPNQPQHSPPQPGQQPQQSNQQTQQRQQDAQQPQNQPQEAPQQQQQSLPSMSEVKGNWKQQVGAAKIAWGKLTEDEILKSEGHAQRLTGIIQERYAITRDEADKQVKSFFEKIKDAIK